MVSANHSMVRGLCVAKKHLDLWTANGPSLPQRGAVRNVAYRGGGGIGARDFDLRLLAICFLTRLAQK